MLSNIEVLAWPFMAAAVLAALLTWRVRHWVVKVGYGQTVRDDGPQSHLAKMGTPTLGGLGMLGAVAVVVLIGTVTDLAAGHRPHPAGLLVVGLALLYGGIGFADDWTKLRYKRPLGLKARVRLPLEIALGAAFALALVLTRAVTPAGSAVQIIPLGAGIGFVLFSAVVTAGASNAVNLTDGLDGLAGGVSLICALTLSAACFMTQQLELAILAAIVAGAAAGFLWFNAHPAAIFMGDVGSLGLGALLSGIAVAARMELLFGLFGVVFVVEALSVVLQVAYFRRTGGKRLFRMAPYHHHLELGGMAETKIVTRFWLVTMVAGAVGLVLVDWMVRTGLG